MMEFARTSDPFRCRVTSDELDGLNITIPSQENLFVSLFLTAWLIGWAIGEIAGLVGFIACL
jgi:hypothetical protein